MVLIYIQKLKEKEIKKMKYIQNIECGNIFPYNSKGVKEALAEARELYDLEDDTNALWLWDYYQIIEA